MRWVGCLKVVWIFLASHWSWIRALFVLEKMSPFFRHPLDDKSWAYFIIQTPGDLVGFGQLLFRRLGSQLILLLGGS